MHIKSFSIWKLSAVLILVSLLIAACPSPLINSYYVQQQNRTKGNGNHNGGNNGNNEEPGGGDIPVPPEKPLEPGKISMFSVILRDGKIAEPAGDGAIAAQLKGKLGGTDATYTGYEFATNFFDKARLTIEKIENYVPKMKYQGTINWENTEIKENGTYTQKISGTDFGVDKPKSTTSSKIIFYRSYGKNPFGLYNDETYVVYGEDGKPKCDDKGNPVEERLMERFVFYYFTGYNHGDLKNCLVAVDTYSKLIFPFAKAVVFKNVNIWVLGINEFVPQVWKQVDLEHRFYEYDPIGYVTKEGNFILTDAYKTKIRLKGKTVEEEKEKYIPDFTGKSPYLGYAGGTQEEEKPLFGVEVYKTSVSHDTQYTVSGKNGEYILEYVDETIESAQVDKEVSFSVRLSDLKSTSPVPTSVTVDNGGGFIKTSILKAGNEQITSPNFTTEAPVIDVTVSIDAVSELADKEGSFTFTFDPPATYNESSPDKIKVKIIRHRLKFSISNIVLKNISVKDVFGDYPAGGSTSKAEFSYEIKARCDAGEWDIFSTNNGAHLSIDTGTQAPLQGKYTLPIDRKTPASHKVDISCKIQENDPLWFNDDDVIIKHEKPLFTLLYNDAGDSGKGSWSLIRTPDPVQSYNEGGWEWKVTAVNMPELNRNRVVQLKIDITTKIFDAGAKGDSDMELSFDVEWK